MFQFINKQLILLFLYYLLVATIAASVIAIFAGVGLTICDSPSLMSLPIAFFSAGNLLAIIPAPYFGEKFGWVKVFIVSGFIGAIGGFLIYYSIDNSSFWLFNIGLFFVGSNTSVGQYVRYIAGGISKAKDSGKSMSFVLIGGIFAAFLGPYMVYFLQDFGYERFSISGLLIFSLCAIQVMVIIGFNDKETNISSKSKNKIKFEWSYLLNFKLYFPIILLSLAFFIMMLLMTIAPLAMQADYNIAFSAVYVAIQLHVFAMYFPSFFTGYIVDRFGAKKVIIFGIMLNLLAVVIANIDTQILNFTLTLFIIGFGWNFLYVGASYLIIQLGKRNPEKKTFIQATSEFSISFTKLFTSGISGLALLLFGWEVINYLILIPLIIILLITMQISFKEEK